MLGPAASPFAGRAYSDESAYAIESAIKTILDQAFERARATLIYYPPVLESVAKRLLEHETLNEIELEQLFGGVRAPGAARSGLIYRPRHEAECA